MRAGLAAWIAAAALAFCASALAQKKDAPPQTFEVTGVLVDARGPLANRIVSVFPLDSKGNALRIRGLTGPSSGKGLNPRATTDPSGRFTVTVARSLFRGYRDDQAALGASEDLGGGRSAIAHETATVKLDPKKDKVDVGRVVLEPLKPRGVAR